MRTRYRKTWRNTVRNEKTQPLKYFEPANLQDIKDIILEAEEQGIKVRAVGSGHSFSDVAITEGYLVDLKRLNSMHEIDDNHLHTSDGTLVYAEGGITVQKFNKLMCKRNLCVLNMGGIDNQTLAGAISTGTHGTGLELPAFTGMVKSILLVAEGGKAYRIEPAAGISHPGRYKEEGVMLRQDDDLFNAALVSLGCMGVIHSFILKLEPMYWLRESKELTCWSKVRPKLEDGSLFEKDTGGQQVNRGIMIAVSPYVDKTGDMRTVVVRHQFLKEKPRRKYSDYFRNIFTRLGGLPVFYWIAAILVRFVPRYVPRLINSSLGSLKDKSYVNRGYRVMHQGVEYIKIRAYDSEFAFDMKDNAYIDALEEIMAKAKELADNHIMYQTSPFGLRFVKGNDAYMSPDSGKTVCYIDTPFLKHTVGADEILNQYQDIAMRKYGGIPHWGKVHNRIFRYPELIAQFYPKLDNWLAAVKRLNPKDTFSNDFFYRLQVSQKLIDASKPKAAKIEAKSPAPISEVDS